MKVIQIGIYPPPIGGISVHIKRLKQNLEKDGHECLILNEGTFENESDNIFKEKRISSIMKILNPKNKILHFHSISYKKRMFMSFFKILNKKVFLTIHGNSLKDQIESLPKFKKLIYVYSLKKLDYIICVNKDTHEFLLEKGFSENSLKTIPAYLNPVVKEIDYKKIPTEVWEFINTQEFLITANGNVRFYKGKDLYGVNDLIELIYTLNKNNNNVSLLFALLGVNNQNAEEKKYYKTLKEKIKTLNLSKKIFFYEVEYSELYPLLKNSNLFIRPTIMDGYGVSIAEALSVSTIAIASDVCRRPNGTLTFETGNFKQLYEITDKVIKDYPVYIDELKNIKPIDYFEEILTLYRE